MLHRSKSRAGRRSVSRRVRRSGLALIAAFVYANRKMFAGPYGGSLVAMGVASLTMFGFRLAILGCTALVIIGLATRETHVSLRNG